MRSTSVSAVVRGNSPRAFWSLRWQRGFDRSAGVEFAPPSGQGQQPVWQPGLSPRPAVPMQRSSSVPTSLMQACSCTSTCALAAASRARQHGGQGRQFHPAPRRPGAAICPAWRLRAPPGQRTACPSRSASAARTAPGAHLPSVPRGSRHRAWLKRRQGPGSTIQCCAPPSRRRCAALWF